MAKALVRLTVEMGAVKVFIEAKSMELALKELETYDKSQKDK